ncbi:hypothetical protein C1645_767663 [Glomus cerebriforme]|uniref:BTB domain-containing protein n=1 Tax=Glomus cerebriforme TaxID=658196 RepID=A0A397SYQ1_9GLOM|nr:hypothetical protein C1645_767663 [Glomus cerebriforme]
MPSLPSNKKFMQHISQIRKNNVDYDVVFIVGRKPDARRMIGHSFILNVRSYYFNTEIQRMDKCNKFDKNNKYQFKFPEYTFELMDQILDFIYGNKIDVLTMDSEFLLNLMNASKRFELTDLVDYLQSYLIESRFNWIRENVFKLINVVFDNEDFRQLRDLIFQWICDDTKWFLSLNQFNELSEKYLIKFLQMDDLSIEEFHIWNAVLDWAFAKNVNLDRNNISQWSDQEIKWFKATLKPLIPFIRFFHISSFKYWDHIHEFNKGLPEVLVSEIFKYYLKGSTPAIYPLLSLRNVRRIDSDLILAYQAEIISLWIENKNPKISMNLEWEYKFNLLYSTRRHGHSAKTFHKNCDNQGATILLVKTEIPDEVIGGFNPVSWGNNESNDNNHNNGNLESPRYSPDLMDVEEESITETSLVIYSPTKLPQTISSDNNNSNITKDNEMNSYNRPKAFLFSLNKNGKNKVGRLSSSDNLDFVHNCGECGPCFGITDLWITPKAAHSINQNIPYQNLINFGYHRQDSYEIRLQDEPGGFQFVDYEIFQVVHV